MRFFQIGATLAAVVSQVLAGPTIAKPGGPKDIIVTEENTTNTTRIPGVQILAAGSAPTGRLQLSLVNSLNSNNVNAYVTGLDSNGILVMLQPNGQWYYPTASQSAIPQIITANVSIPMGPKGSTTNITLPGFLSAGRVWFADGSLQFFTVPGGAGTALVQPSAANPSDPNSDVNWGFVELTNIASGIYVNVSYVDFLGIPLGIQLIGSAGTQTVQGVTTNAVADVCADLNAQAAKESQPWDSLCVADTAGNLIRVLSPALYLTISPQAFSNYWTDYINQVWQKYSTTPLTIDTQASPGVVSCTTANGTLTCAGGDTKYAQPSPLDIFSCANGPFYIRSYDPVNLAVIPRLCAAFNRATLTIPNGNLQPFATQTKFYSSSPANWYSHFVHTHELDGKGYAFSYDDVTADGKDNLSGLLADPNPQILAVTVGGPIPLASTAASSTVPAAAATTSAVAKASTTTTKSPTTTKSSIVVKAVTTTKTSAPAVKSSSSTTKASVTTVTIKAYSYITVSVSVTTTVTVPGKCAVQTVGILKTTTKHTTTTAAKPKATTVVPAKKVAQKTTTTTKKPAAAAKKTTTTTKKAAATKKATKRHHHKHNHAEAN